ncbi:hypothetical protein [Pseudonocardia pini]|uniref:hypothetical protein n=1 Tax=Pseudonocardia pini TaxID=2758030 RepID=UPI0015F0EDE7|nr:hypothetical protein [Pseudonocardia pini]
MVHAMGLSTRGRRLLTTAVAVIVLAAHLLAGCCAESEATSVDCPAAAPAAAPRSVAVRTQASDPPCADAAFEPAAVVLGSDEVGALLALVVLGFAAALSSRPPATSGRRRGAPRAPPSHARRLATLSVLRT